METKLNTIDLKSINLVEDVISEELRFYRSVQENFGRRYKTDLSTFEEKLNKCELPEHPDWEDSIEWRNAYEDFKTWSKVKEVLDWTLGFLKRQNTSLQTQSL